MNKIEILVFYFKYNLNELSFSGKYATFANSRKKRITFCVLFSGFMFDQLSEKLRCQGLALMCPPMCLNQNPSGCSTCDCSNIDPSHPKAPGTSGGNSLDPSRPLFSGDYLITVYIQ
jgi:hypothetical protein